MRKKLNFCSHLKDASIMNTFPAKCLHLVGPKLFSKGNKPAAFLFKLIRKSSAACTVQHWGYPSASGSKIWDNAGTNCRSKAPASAFVSCKSQYYYFKMQLVLAWKVTAKALWGQLCLWPLPCSWLGFAKFVFQALSQKRELGAESTELGAEFTEPLCSLCSAKPPSAGVWGSLRENLGPV